MKGFFRVKWMNFLTKIIARRVSQKFKFDLDFYYQRFKFFFISNDISQIVYWLKCDQQVYSSNFHREDPLQQSLVATLIKAMPQRFLKFNASFTDPYNLSLSIWPKRVWNLIFFIFLTKGWISFDTQTPWPWLDKFTENNPTSLYELRTQTVASQAF